MDCSNFVESNRLSALEKNNAFLSRVNFKRVANGFTVTAFSAAVDGSPPVEKLYTLNTFSVAAPVSVGEPEVFSSIVDRAIAVGSSGRLATVLSSSIEVTPAGTYVSACEVADTSIFVPGETVEVAASDVVEGEDGGYCSFRCDVYYCSSRCC